jgi:hypothetical protein
MTVIIISILIYIKALDSLSSPLPSVQLPRLGRLYLDLHESVLSLFPPNHPILVSLSSPLPPTSSPLHSALSLLMEILIALRQRCAPVRDETVDNLLASLALPSSPLPQFVIDMIKAVIALADQMKSDLNTFVIGSMTDSQLRNLLSNDVKSRERDLVLKIWGTKDLVRHSWRVWLDNSLDAPHGNRWISALIQALFSDKPVSCRLPTSTPSEATQSFELPPQLFFSVPLLLDLQNHLQAIVIAAALRSLARLPPHSSSDFMNRIWTLLKSEINSSGNSIDYDDTERTKIINLADEVIRATQLSFASGKLNTNEEQTLRSAVERTLRPNDPVFLLLKKRLMGSLEKLWLSSSVAPNGSTVTRGSSTSILEKMSTGKGPRPGQETSISEKRLKHMVSESLSDFSPSSSSHQGVVVGTEAERMVIAGFEDVVLRKAIGETAQKLADCIEWIGSVWGDLV